mgnify:CR=1 FL=1
MPKVQLRGGFSERNGLKENKNVSHLLNPNVLEIIREKKLYQNGEN